MEKSASRGARRLPGKCRRRRPTIVVLAATAGTVDRAGKAAIAVLVVMATGGTGAPGAITIGSAVHATMGIACRALGPKVIEDRLRGRRAIRSRALDGTVIAGTRAIAAGPAGRPDHQNGAGSTCAGAVFVLNRVSCRLLRCCIRQPTSGSHQPCQSAPRRRISQYRERCSPGSGPASPITIDAGEVPPAGSCSPAPTPAAPGQSPAAVGIGAAAEGAEIQTVAMVAGTRAAVAPMGIRQGEPVQLVQPRSSHLVETEWSAPRCEGHSRTGNRTGCPVHSSPRIWDT